MDASATNTLLIPAQNLLVEVYQEQEDSSDAVISSSLPLLSSVDSEPGRRRVEKYRMIFPLESNG